jgi:hypothetical protein
MKKNTQKTSREAKERSLSEIVEQMPIGIFFVDELPPHRLRSCVESSLFHASTRGIKAALIDYEHDHDLDGTALGSVPVEQPHDIASLPEIARKLRDKGRRLILILLGDNVRLENGVLVSPVDHDIDPALEELMCECYLGELTCVFISNYQISPYVLHYSLSEKPFRERDTLSRWTGERSGKGIDLFVSAEELLTGSI